MAIALRQEDTHTIFIANPYLCARTGMYASSMKQDVKQRWFATHKMYGALIKRAEGIFETRVVTPVIFGDKKKIYMMDAVTGTLFDPDNNLCLSSLVLEVQDFFEDVECEMRLRNTKDLSVKGDGVVE